MLAAVQWWLDGLVPPNHHWVCEDAYLQRKEQRACCQFNLMDTTQLVKRGSFTAICGQWDSQQLMPSYVGKPSRAVVMLGQVACYVEGLPL